LRTICIILGVLSILLFSPDHGLASVIHIVHQGETLWYIAKEYGTTTDKIAQINGLTRKNQNRLVPGTSLLIPGQTYIVQPEDDLWSIANTHSLPLQKLLDHNNHLNGTTIYPGQKISIPALPKKELMIGSFLVPTNDENDKALLRQKRKLLSRTALFEYHPDYQANLSDLPEQDIKMLWKKNVIPYATVTNLSAKGFDDNLAHHLVINSSLRKKLVNNIHSLLHQNDYKGVLIDFEGLQPEDRQHFNRFIKELAAKLHPSGMRVAIAVPPMQGDRFPEYHAAYDYRTLGKHADIIFLMTYDWHWPGGHPGPIAPIGEIRQTVEYAISVIPKSKVWMGIPLYAYDWTLPKKIIRPKPIRKNMRLDWLLDTKVRFIITKKRHNRGSGTQIETACAMKSGSKMREACWLNTGLLKNTDWWERVVGNWDYPFPRENNCSLRNLRLKSKEF
jgi:spore germination protein